MFSVKNILKKSGGVVLLFSFFYFLWGCGTKKNTALNRFYHSVNSKFNILFNGKKAYQKSIDSLWKNKRFDYQKPLPFQIMHEEKIDSTSLFFMGLNFAEEKAVKAIQKHSMLIKGEEYNTQIDEAYLLLGKCRYYTHRLSPALESFLEITQKDTDSDKMQEALIWRAKTEIALGDYYTALATLQYFINYPNTDNYRAQTYELIAQIRFLEGDTDAAINALKTAVRLTKKQKKIFFKRRILIGQLYEKIGNIKSAKYIFKKITTELKTPYPYDVFAALCWAKLSEKKERKKVFKTLKKYSRKQKYRLYFGDVLFEMGQIAIKKNNTKKAMQYYKKASEFTEDKTLKIKVMKTLAQYHLEKNNYQKTNRYYDTIIRTDPKGNNLVKLKKEGLSKLIKIKTSVQKNELMLKLFGLSKNERIKFYREKAYEKIIAQNPDNTHKKTLKNNWYFHNKARIMAGKTSFIEKWGDIALIDNWKWNAVLNNTPQITNAPQKKIKDTVEIWVQKQLIALKKNETSKDNIRMQYLQQLFQLGLLYKEVFKAPKKAQECFETVLKNSKSKPSLKIGSYYHLYQTLQKIDPQKANRYKNKMLSEFPNHTLSNILTQKNNPTNSSLKKQELAYNKALWFYKQQELKTALKEVNQIILKGKNNFTSKTFLLKALLLVKLGKHKQSKEILEFLKVRYGHQPEGVRAGILLKKIKTQNYKNIIK